ncbi:MAG TPA: hypothetical protein VGK74_11830 [Symbiobacteriaceae bacterium]
MGSNKQERISLDTVKNALDAEAWESASDLAARALAQGKWKKSEEAFLHFARTHSLSNKNQFSLALESGQRAVMIAEQARAWDVLARALIELAFVQRKLNLQEQSVLTIQKYFEFLSRYGVEGQRRYLVAMFGLGASFRAAGRFEEALRQFMRTYEEAKKRRDHRWAEEARQNATEQALALRQVTVAEGLIGDGDAYIALHPENDSAVASHLIDKATLSLLKGDIPAAKGQAQEAIARATNLPTLSALAYDVLHLASRAEGNNFAALAGAVLAKLNAEEDETHPYLIAQFSNSIQELALRDPGAAEEFIARLTSQR